MKATAEKAPPKPSTTAAKPAAQPFFGKAPVGEQAALSSEIVDVSSGMFTPSERVKGEIDAEGHKGLMVRVASAGLAGEGKVKIRVDSRKNYDSIGKGSMPLRNPWAEELGGMYVNFTVKNNAVTGGYASLKPGGGDTNDWLQAVQKNSSLLGGLGLKVENLPVPVNKYENGKLTLGVTNLKVVVGSVLDARLNLLLENNNKPKIDATADVKIKGVAKGQLTLNNAQERLAGQVALAVDFKSFSGSAEIKYNADGTVDIGGRAAYNADKLSGEIQFVATDLETANKFAKDAIAAAGGKENVQDAPPPAPVPPPKANRKERALAATGQLRFNLTQWFAGTVNVVVDGKGAVTVIGRIAPPAEIELFKQKDWDKELIKFEAKAYYGLPVIGNLNLFANISFHAIAKLGPAKIYQIEILGTYSTDPEIQKFIQISGSINISAYAGLRLRAEGGAGVEIASHDLKFGVGVNADLGVQAYADARPTIGYRDPGVFYISGTLEMVAQPMLGLGGDFFIQLETPWWSPLSDHKWIWPLFAKEWPLSDPIGISALVKEYELGSGKVPEVELKKPEFDPSKFMTSMVDRELPDKKGVQGPGQGTFKEDGTVTKPEVPPKKPAPKKAAGPAPKKKAPAAKAGKSGSPDPKAAKESQTGKIFQSAAKSLEALKSGGPLTRGELNQQLAKIKAQVRGIDFDVQLKGPKWIVKPKAGGKTGRELQLEAKDPKEVGTKSNAGKYDGQLGKIVNFTAGKEFHRLWIALRANNAVVMMASVEKSLAEHLNDYETLAHQIKDNGKVTGLIANARMLLNGLDSKADTLAADLTKPDVKPDQIIAEDNTVEGEEDRLSSVIEQILALLGAGLSPGPDYPMASAPGIGNVERHGSQVQRLRSGPQIWQTESEHIIPFATGRSLWQALALYLPERNWPEDNQQTTIVIYERAARIKTPADNRVSEHFSNAVDGLDIVGTLKALTSRYEHGDITAFSSAYEVLDRVLSPLNKAKDDAVERTVDAIAQENREKENGFATENRQRRAIPPNVEPPKPSAADVAKAAKRQYDDIIHLVKQEIVSKEEVRRRVNRMLNRD